MTEPTTVFVVTAGSYSDYHIESIWSTQEEADFAAERLDGPRMYVIDKAYVDEWVLNTGTQEQEVMRWVANYENGVITVADKPQTFTSVPSTDTWRLAKIYDASQPLRGVGYGITPEHARKNLSDAVAEALAIEAGQG